MAREEKRMVGFLVFNRRLVPAFRLRKKQIASGGETKNIYSTTPRNVY